MYKSIAKITLLISFVASSYANASPIGPLERERAKTLNLILDKTISIAERKKKLEKSKMKLLDLERMTINNKQINKNPDTHTIRAFEDFRRTFETPKDFRRTLDPDEDKLYYVNNLAFGQDQKWLVKALQPLF